MTAMYKLNVSNMYASKTLQRLNCLSKRCCQSLSLSIKLNHARVREARAEDWRRSGTNATVGVPDTPAYHGIDAFIHLARARRRVSEQHGLQMWGLDHEATYRQLPVENPCHTVVVLNTPQGPTLWRIVACGAIAELQTSCAGWSAACCWPPCSTL